MQPKLINRSGTKLAQTRIKLAQMNGIEIKAIIKQGENSQVEFKECQDRISHSVYETICSFLNYKGGTIFLGVNDTGEIIGVNKSNASAMVKNLINTSNNEELFVPYANVMPELVEIDGMTIIVIQIPEGESVYQYKHRFFDRNGDADVDVTKQPQLLNQLFERKSQNLFESRCVAGLGVDDLDGDTFAQCRKVKTREGGGHPWELMGDMDLLRSCQLVRTGKDDSCSLTYAKGEYLVEGGSGRSADRRPFQSFMHEAVYAALKHYPEIKVDEILTMINSSRRTLYRILADLRKDGFVENTGNKNHPKWNVYNG